MNIFKAPNSPIATAVTSLIAQQSTEPATEPCEHVGGRLRLRYGPEKPGACMSVSLPCKGGPLWPVDAISVGYETRTREAGRVGVQIYGPEKRGVR